MTNSKEIEVKQEIIKGLLKELEKNCMTIHGLIMDGLKAEYKDGRPDKRLRLSYLKLAMQLFLDNKKDLYRVANKYGVPIDDTFKKMQGAFAKRTYA